MIKNRFDLRDFLSLNSLRHLKAQLNRSINRHMSSFTEVKRTFKEFVNYTSRLEARENRLAWTYVPKVEFLTKSTVKENSITL